MVATTVTQRSICKSLGKSQEIVFGVISGNQKMLSAAGYNVKKLRF